MAQVDRAFRKIEPKHLQRAMMVEDVQVGPYLEEILMDMHQSLERWRYGKGPCSDLQLALDAFIALLTAAELKGLAE